MNAGWKTVNLGEACTFVSRGVSPKYVEDEGILVLNQKCVRNHRVSFDLARRHDNRTKPFNEERLLRAGDVLVNSTGTGTLGRVAQVTEDPSEQATVDSHVSIVRPKKELFHLAYFGYAMILIEPLITEAGKGSGGQTELSREDLRSNFEIPLPPLAEQKRIVALLDEAFAGIETLSSNAKTRSSAALQVFEQERDSFFANSDNKYAETTISDITTRLQYGTSEKSASTGRYVVLRMGNIQDGEIDYEDLKYTSSQEVIDQYCLKPGDVLFNRTNSPQWVGKSAIYRGEIPAVFAGYNIKVHTITDKVDSEFLTFFLNSDRAMSFGRSTFISSVNQANINAEKLRSYRLPLPPLREQKAIADRLSQIRKISRELAAIYQNSLAQSHHLKAAILSSAFNGTL